MNILAAEENTTQDILVSDEVSTFNGLYEANYSRIYNYVHYRVSDFHDAEDLISKVFEKAFNKLNYYQVERGTISTWLFSITRNTITDYYRSMMRYRYTSMETIEEIACSDAGLDDILMSSEKKQQLLKALAVLSKRERIIIALKFWGGTSNRDIAIQVGISESNTGIILYRAMRRLRKVLEKQDMHICDGYGMRKSFPCDM